MRLFTIVFLVVVSFMVVGVGNGQNPNKEGIVGRVVDANGRPVAFANVTYQQGPNDNMITGGNTDADGRFEIEDKPMTSGEIWITSGIDREKWWDLISPGVNLTSKYLIRPVIELGSRGKKKFVDLGDVRVHAYYSPVKILVRPKWRDRVFSYDWISFRVTDSDGILANDTALPISRNGINRNESSITIALPEGEWKIEMRTEKMRWKVVAKRLIVTRDTPIKIDWPSQKQ